MINYPATGNLTYFDTSGNLDTLSQGQTSQPLPVAPPSGCVSGSPAASALATLTYGAQTITATIVSAPAVSSAPVISGTPAVGSTLSVASNGSWNSTPPVTGYSYQWLACSSSCQPIPGATGSSFTLTSAQAGAQIKLQVTAANGIGNTSADSNAVGPVAQAPTLLSHATIGGGLVAGDTLTVDPGTWSGSPTFSYQWQLCPPKQQGNVRIYSVSYCTAIPGATGTSYASTSAETGDDVAVEVTATNAAGSTQTDTGLFGAIDWSATVATEPSPAVVRSALGQIKHPSSRKAITALLKSGAFKTRFDAPDAGSLRITWTSTVTTGAGKHKKRRTVTIASRSGRPGAAGTLLNLTIHLTSAGRSLLRQRPHGLVVTATEKFQPVGGSWTTVTKHFKL